MILYVVMGGVVLVLIYSLVIYNSLIKSNNTVKEAFATMDVYLKKRWDLIPNIVETVKGYAKHEKETLENVVKLRNTAYNNLSPDDKIKTNEILTQDVSRLMMLAENYPDLKANQVFLDLSSQLTKVEDDIAQSRKYYNAVVKNFNNKVQMFPSNLFANIFGYETKKMFEADSSERASLKVEL
ncbi:MAG: LemA family protein [Clostridia bacterium]|nr:LemA family protein [Clostridia bacterium]MDD4048474.1 LemA family protein [Clostridia bacterium]